MPVTIALTLACAAVTCDPATQGQVPAAPDVEGVVAAPTVPATPTPPAPAKVDPVKAAPVETAPVTMMKATPAKLVAFDGAHDFMKTSRRLRIWRAAVDLDMKIDAQGEATDCEVVDRFRKTYVNKKLCEVAMAHHTFEPARNAKNEAVEGSYRVHISYADLRKELE